MYADERDLVRLTPFGLLLAFAHRYRAHLAIVSTGLLTLTGAIAWRLLPDDGIGTLLGGYLAYSLGAGGATLALIGGALLLGMLRGRSGRGA